MCGIVGLLVKNPELRSRLGELALPMLIGMTERGPDSAGLAVFTAPEPESRRKLCLYSGTESVDWNELEREIQTSLDGSAELRLCENHAVLSVGCSSETARDWIRARHPSLKVLSAGRAMQVYKETGRPGAVAARYHFSEMQGTHVVAHTRMATESAVTPERAHPFTAGEDWCLVHNGSLSNPNAIRRKLEPRGIRFETDNDTEAACRYYEWRMREGDDLAGAIRTGFKELDGFYTFLMGTGTEMALVRDAFACKPAIVAETDDYVAISSEYRSLAALPGVRSARLFEPVPEEIYVWRV